MVPQGASRQCRKTANQVRPWPPQAASWFGTRVSVGRNACLKNVTTKDYLSDPAGVHHTLGGLAEARTQGVTKPQLPK